jgi:hypothetical protein
VEAMGLEPTDLLTARLTPTALTPTNRSVKVQHSSAIWSLPLTRFGLFLATTIDRSVVPRLVPRWHNTTGKLQTTMDECEAVVPFCSRSIALEDLWSVTD